MFLDQQVTNLEQSKQLYELGINQESLFYWIRVPTSNPNVEGYGLTYLLNILKPRSSFKEIYSAFTATELMEHIPDRIIIPDRAPFDCYRFNLFRSLVVEDGMQVYPTFIINYLTDTYEAPHFLAKHLFKNIWSKNLPTALADTLIYIKENKLDQPYHLPETIGDNINAT